MDRQRGQHASTRPEGVSPQGRGLTVGATLRVLVALFAAASMLVGPAAPLAAAEPGPAFELAEHDPVQPTLSEAPQATHSALESITVDLAGEGTFELPIRATHITLSWHEPHEAHLTVAFSDDGSAFGPAADVVHDHAAEDDHDLTHSGVIWTGGASWVRVTSDLPIVSLTITAIDVGVTPRTSPAAELPSRPATRLSGEQPLVDTPQIISRAEWGSNESYRFETVDGELVDRWPPSFFPVQKLIVHHTAGVNDDPDPAGTVRAIQRWQASPGGRDWGDIGYNFLIDEHGRIYEGRYSREYEPGETRSGTNLEGNSVQGAHVLGHNSGTIGIALLGHLVNQDASPATRAALEWLLAWLAQKHGIDPLLTSAYVHPENTTPPKTNPNISGHGDWTSTACPGKSFHDTLPALRQAVASRVATGGSPAIPPFTPKPSPPPPPPAEVTVPQGLTAVAESNFVVRLTWQASTSTVAGQMRYRVNRNDSAVGTQQTGLTFVDQRKQAETLIYRVRAIDAAGNKSDLSPQITVTTVRHAEGTSGVTIPTSLTAVARSGFVVQLSWQASSSPAAGPIRYRVFRNGVAIGTQQTELSYRDQRKRARTFSYQVRAIDAAGNKSPLSKPVTVTTAP
jgi:hypothetical protein